MSDLLPKDKDGNPVGKVVEVEYDVFDLPAWDFEKLIGGPELRMALGILKRMTENAGLEFAEELLSLLEIPDEERRIDLVKEVLPFVANVFAVHDLRLETEMVNQALTDFQGENKDQNDF